MARWPTDMVSPVFEKRKPPSLAHEEHQASAVAPEGASSIHGLSNKRGPSCRGESSVWQILEGTWHDMAGNQPIQNCQRITRRPDADSFSRDKEMFGLCGTDGRSLTCKACTPIDQTARATTALARPKFLACTKASHRSPFASLCRP